MPFAFRFCSTGIGSSISLLALLASALAPCGCAGTAVVAAQGHGGVRAEFRSEGLSQRQRAREGAPEEQDVTVGDLLRRGDHFRKMGQISKAYAAYARAHLKDAKDPEPLQQMAFLALRDTPTEAERLFRELAEESPKTPIFLTGIGMARLAQGDAHGAVPPLEEAVSLDPSLTAALSSLGVAYDRMGRHEDAQECFRAARELDPGDTEMLNNLGVSYLLSENYELAAEALGAAVALGADDPAVHNNLGLALGLLGQLHESLEQFRISGSPGDAYNNLGYVVFLRGDYDAAIGHFEKALLSNNTDERRVIRNISRAEQFRARASPASQTPSIP